MEELNPERLPSLPQGAHAVGALPADPPDLIIGSIPEIPELKIDLFRRLGEAYGSPPLRRRSFPGSK